MSELFDVRMKVSRPPTGVYDGMWCEHIVTFHDRDGRVYEGRCEEGWFGHDPKVVKVLVSEDGRAEVIDE